MASLAFFPCCSAPSANEQLQFQHVQDFPGVLDVNLEETSHAAQSPLGWDLHSEQPSSVDDGVLPSLVTPRVVVNASEDNDPKDNSAKKHLSPTMVKKRDVVHDLTDAIIRTASTEVVSFGSSVVPQGSNAKSKRPDRKKSRCVTFSEEAGLSELEAAARIQAAYRGTSIRKRSSNESIISIEAPQCSIMQTFAQLFEVGEQVSLCGMEFQELNCMKGVVVRRDERTRSYTIEIASIGDTISLPFANLRPPADTDVAHDESGEYDLGEMIAYESERSEDWDGSMTMTKTNTVATAFESIRKRTMSAWSGARKRYGSVASVAPYLATPLLSAWWAEKKQRAKEQLLEISGPMRTEMLTNVGELIKEIAMRDPDIWPGVRPVILKTVNGIWDDIVAEIEFNLEAAVCDMRKMSEIEAASRLKAGPDSGSRCGFVYNGLLRIRAFMLFHYLPYNRTFFGKTKDYWYLFMVFLTLIPVHGVRTFFFTGLLFMLLVPGPPDEFQLTNYILLFKGTQFFTAGVIALFLGAMQYYRCYIQSADLMRDCVQNYGPGAGEQLWGQFGDYLGSVLLVWVAFLHLPKSIALRDAADDSMTSDMAEKETTYCFCLKGKTKYGRGGRLRKLLIYDIICFAASFLIILMLHVDMRTGRVEMQHDFLQAAVFWSRVIYALSSLPFSLFILPVFFQLLTHCDATGHNQHGACVEFAYRKIQID